MRPYPLYGQDANISYDIMYLENNDTICAPATVPGTGAISVIRVSGENALEIADKVVKCGKPEAIMSAKGYTIKFGTICDEDGSPVDEVLVSIFRAPHSYTGENSVEISCHASKYIVQQIILLLLKAGARAAEPGEFTRRAFLNGKMDLAQAEAVADLIASQSAGAHKIAYNQMKGGFSSELKEMRSRLLEIVALMELELDFSEEEVEFADRSQLNTLLDRVMKHISRLIDSFRLGNAIKNGVPVAIAGATNTGKSTLLNALLGEDRAIVSDVHGTTRDTVEETLNIDGILFRFIDTAGIRETSETVEKIGIERTWKKISEADIVLGMTDITRRPEQIGEELDELLRTAPENRSGQADTDPVAEQMRHPLPCRTRSPASIHDRLSCFERTPIGKTPADFRQKEGRHTGAERYPVRQQERQTRRIRHHSHHQPPSRRSPYQNLRSEALTRVKSGLASGIPTDLVAQDIREALYYIGSIVGEISDNEVLGVIFSRFCIGK